jgi:hypothetical protein
MRLKTMMALCLGTVTMLSGCGEKTSDGGEPAVQSAPAGDSKAAIRSAIIARNFGEAARRAKELTESSPEDAESWLLLARAEALSDNEGAALDALDRAGWQIPIGHLLIPPSALSVIAIVSSRSKSAPILPRMPAGLVRSLHQL